MQSRFNVKDIVRQCLDLVTGDINGNPHNILDERKGTIQGVVESFSNHYDGRLKLHLYGGQVASWRLPQSVIDDVAREIHVAGNVGTVPRGWDHV